MNESMLQSLMRLFAIMVSINRDAVHILARNFVESFLLQQFSRNLANKYLDVFDQYTRELDHYEKGKKGKKISAWSVKILAICQQIVEELHIRHRFMILLSLTRFSRYFSDTGTRGTEFSNTILDAVRTVADGLLISPEEFENCAAFITDKFYNVPDREVILIVSDDREFLEGEVKHLQKDHMKGHLVILKIRRAGIYLFQYVGRSRLEIGGQYIFPRHVYILPKGASVRGEGITPIYYSDIASGFISYEEGQQVTFCAKEIEYHFRNSSSGIQKFSFSANSGQLVGIIGASGAGKSTLLKLLNGSLLPEAGGIYINGHRLDRKNEELEGMIGYIPQDDLLLEELTVFQNLWFNARLCLDGFTPVQIHEAVIQILKDLELYEARELKVGTPLNKYISGGQRKRLNLALELIREPHILFVDEPTSGLSSTDSENVIALLKEQALKGKVVISTIHQPSSELFKQFDHLLVLDKGGYPVYSGNPVEGITYFKELAERVDAGESECPACGHTSPDDILNIIEARGVDEYGEYTRHRRTSPEEWYGHFLDRIDSKGSIDTKESWIPYNRFMVPSRLRQFGIYFRRNLLSKLADRQFMSIAFLVSPLLALILGFFTKYVSGTGSDPHAYLFSQNENLPAYLFMSVVVALFLGLIMAAEEIIKDRRILERETFLNLNKSAYLLSKILLLFLFSAIQMLLFVCTGNLILVIRGMWFTYWLILFTAACSANLMGLIISDGLRSVVAIYVVVPFLLVPQILLAGVIVKFDKLHYRFASHQVVPFTADLMTSRWAYEALAVNQFLNNRYQKDLTGLESLESNVVYDMTLLVPELVRETENAIAMAEGQAGPGMLEGPLKTIREGLMSITLTDTYSHIHDLEATNFSTEAGHELLSWLRSYRRALSFQRDRIERELDNRIDSLQNVAGGKTGYLKLKRNFYNDQLADLVLNRSDLQKIVKDRGILVRKMEPIYMAPVKKNGRSHFYSSEKRIGERAFSTVFFNICVMWAMNIILYILLRFSVLRRCIDYSARLRHVSGSMKPAL